MALLLLTGTERALVTVCCRVSLVLKESEDTEAEKNPKDKGF
jgi:hypothetical protein